MKKINTNQLSCILVSSFFLICTFFQIYTIRDSIQNKFKIERTEYLYEYQMNLEQYKLFQKCKNLPLWIINGYFRPHKKEHYKKDVWKFLIYKEDIELKNYCYKLSDNNEDCNAHSILEGYGYPGKLFAFNESGRANKMLCIIEEYNYKPLIDILPIFLISFLLSLSFFIGIFFVKETIN